MQELLSKLFTPPQSVSIGKFILRPLAPSQSKVPAAIKLWYVARLVSWALFLNLLVGFTLLAVMYLIGFKPTNAVQTLAEETPLLSVILAVIVAPIREESLFRLWFRFRPSFWAISFAFLVELLSEIAFKLLHITLPPGIVPLIFIRFVFPAVCSLLVYPLLRISKVQTSLSSMLEKHFRPCFYLSCLAFAYLHLFNYSNLGAFPLLVPFLPLTQLMTGVILGFIRSKYGFFWGVLTHASFNLVLILPVVLFLSSTPLLKGIGMILLLGLLALAFAGMLLLGLDVILAIAERVKR